MLGEITDAMKNGDHASDYFEMQEILINHWEKMNILLYCLGFHLIPIFMM